ncbi:MAG: undecaprenyl-diphosphate phosphatase [Candidatus Omnitrophota bacterium]
MLEQILFGITQGIAEWLPVSSEGVMLLIKTHIFGASQAIGDTLRYMLFLHLGTFLAALIYFRKDVKQLLIVLFHFSKSNQENQKILQFLISTTVISGLLGLVFLHYLDNATAIPGKIATLIVGWLLIATGLLQIASKQGGKRSPHDITQRDRVILGLAQGFAVLPGLSRSGLTVASLLLLGFDKVQAIRLSFLMSLPIVLFANIILNVKDFNPHNASFLGLIFSFIFGLATIHLFIKIAQKINFGYFVAIFGLLTILSALI